MNKRIVALAGLLVAISVFAFLFYITINRGAGNKVENINTGRSYGTIQEAIDADETVDGHTLIVYPGKYVENVNVTKMLSIKGQNRSLAIIEGGRRGFTAVLMRADSCTFANFTVRGGVIGIQCFYVNGCRVIDNVVINCTTSIETYFSTSSLIEGNQVFNGSLRGIHVYNSTGTILMNNRIENIAATGTAIAAIHVQYSSNNTIAQNQLMRNPCGLQLEETASNSTIFHNNFVNNTRQVNVYSTTNIWDDGYPSGGNYWSDYVGGDLKSGPNQDLLGSDGIGDWLYWKSWMGPENFDRYPLMMPYSATEYARRSS